MLRRLALTAAAIGSAGVAHALTLQRSETHDLSSAAMHYMTFMAMKAAGRISRRAMERDFASADFQQEELLKGLITANKDTEFGRDHGFAALLAAPDPVQAFRQSIPLTQYADYSYYVDRIGEGESGVLTAEDVELLGVTSGTSGRRQLLPCPSSLRSHFFLRGITATFDALFSTWPEAFGLQKTLKLSYMPTTLFTAAGIPVGPASSSPASKDFDRTLHLYTTPGEAFKANLPERESTYLHLLFALRDRKVGIIEANFASLPHRAAGVLEEEWRRLADDIETGTVSPSATPSLGGAARRRMERLMSPSPCRADEVRAACEAGMRGVFRRIWPDLHVILSTATGSFAHYSMSLAKVHGEGVPVYSPLYAASEGLLGICLTPCVSGDGTGSLYALVPSSMFFEFIPVECSGETQPQTLRQHELHVPGKYELVVTTRGGLCRWRIGDVVQCVGFEGQSPIIRFCYRQGQVLNIRGEKVSEEALALALQDAADVAGKTLGATAEFAASAEFQGSREGSHFGTGDKGLGHYRDVTAGLNAPVSPPAILDYTACEPVLLDRSRGASRSWLIPAKWAGSAPGYTLFVEYEETRGSPGGEAGQLRLDSSSLDKALRERSPVYGSFRDKGSIGEVHVVEVSSGSFAGLRERWLRERGATPNQQKVPRVLRDERAAEYLWSHRK